MDVEDAPTGQMTAQDLTTRVPAQSVMTQLLTLQEQVPPRNRLARALGVDPVEGERAAWYRGALGELAVGRLPTKLPDDWHVLHAVPVGKDESDIDHVVFGPGGVYTVNTKNHSGQKVWVAGGTLMVNGQKQRHVRNAEHEAERAARLLSQAAGFAVDVTPVVAVVDPASLTVRERHAKVVVLTSSQLVRWLKKRPVRLSLEQVSVLTRAAVDPSVWHSRPSPSPDPRVIQAAFAGLRDEVRRARSMRRAWAMGLIGLGGTVALTAGPAVLESALTSLVR